MESVEERKERLLKELENTKATIIPNVDHKNDCNFWLKALELKDLEPYTKRLINKVLRKELRKLLIPALKGGMWDE